MDDKKVKGTMLLDFVRMIRQNKGKDWNKFLKPEDWEIVQSNILPSKWYPYQTYIRCALAAFELLAGGKLELARANGQMMAKALFEKTYKSVVEVKDPMKGLNQFVRFYGAFFNFSSLKIEKIDEKHVEIYHNYDAGAQANMPYCNQLMGMFDVLVEMNGGKNSKLALTAKQWEGASATVIDIIWEKQA